jgi:hypothetical protein
LLASRRTAFTGALVRWDEWDTPVVHADSEALPWPSGYAIALLLPGVRAERSLWPRKVNPNMVLIQQEGSIDDSWPTIAPRMFRSWEGRTAEVF